MNALPYLLTASLYLALFYGCYHLLLRRNTFFGLNRVYLLASVMLSLLLPLVELPGGTGNSLPVGAITLPTFVVSRAHSPQSNGLTTVQCIWLFYGLGVIAMLIRLGVHVRAVFALIKRGIIERKQDYTLVRLPDGQLSQTPSFSFGRYLVLNHTDALTQPE
ncbi:MAG: M56 family peptidase, partial [Cytophagaceae bacterium]